jgi:hypothetical protein
LPPGEQVGKAAPTLLSSAELRLDITQVSFDLHEDEDAHAKNGTQNYANKFGGDLPRDLSRRISRVIDRMTAAEADAFLALIGLAEECGGRETIEVRPEIILAEAAALRKGK